MRKKLSAILGFSLKQLGKNFLLPFLLLAFGGNVWGQTDVTYTSMTTITCPTAPTSTITGTPTGLTFSQISRGAGVTCSTAGGSISGSGFNGNLAANITGERWYTFSITSDATKNFTINSLKVVARISSASGSPRYSVQYKIGAGSLTEIGTFTPTTSAATYTITPTTAIPVGASQVVNIYIIPYSLTATGTTARVENNTSVNVTTTDASSCAGPTSPTVGTITSSGATLSWTAPSSAPAGGYDYYYSTTNTAPTGSSTVTNTSATSATLSLSPNTTYYWWVRSHCGSSDLGSWVSGGSFTTSQIPVALPYTEGFEGSNGNNWTFVNGSATNKWYVGSATQNGGTQSLYISNNNGTTNAYTNTSPGSTYAYRDIIIPNGATTATISFDYRVAGEANYDLFRVWMVPVSYTPTATTTATPGVITALSGRIQIGGNFVSQATYLNYVNSSVNVSSFAGQTMRLVFEWQNDDSVGTQTPAAAIDNLSFSMPNVCTTPTAQPTALVFGTTSATAVNATFTGVASPNTPSGYIILRSLSAIAPTLVNGTTYATNSTQTLGGNSYTVIQGSATASLTTSIANTGLASNTTYYYYVYSFNNACTGQPFYLNTTPLTGSKITCPAPATAATSTVTNTGVSVSWTASAVGGSAETIKYRFELYSDSGRTALVAGYPLADTVSPVNITTGLTANTTYYYRIIAYNSSCQSTNLDGDFYNGVCIPGTTTNTGYYISNFSTTKGYTSNISNLSSGNTSGGYQDNFATQKVEMYPTGSFDFSYTNVGGAQAGTSIWIDWNNDWVFDTSERVYTSGAYATSGSGSIIVPAGKAIGDYRMRVRTERYATSPDNPCSANFTAETEDYKISVVAQPNYVVYTDATTANNTINNTLNIYLKDFDGVNNFYTDGQTDIWMHAGIKTNSETWLYQNAGQDFNNTSTLIHFIRESTNPNVYKATIKLADWFCIPTGTTVEGLNLVFRNQYGSGGNNQTADMVLDLTPVAVVVNAPTSPASSLVTTTTATISWTAPTTGAVKGFDYYYNTSNTAPTSGTTPSGTVAGNVTTANLSSLSPATTYYYWIRTKGCDTNSAWTSVANFTTACAVVTAPTSLQTFDTYLPACWSEATGLVAANSVLSGTISRWDTSANFGNGSGSNKGAKVNLWGTNNDWLISNQIDLGSTAGQYRVSYKMAITNYNGTTAQTTLGSHQVRLIVSTDGGTTWSNTNVVKTYTGEGTYSNTGVTEHVNLIGYSGIVKIAFVSSTTSSSPDVDFHIDDFVVETIPPTLLANNGNSLSLTFADQAITTTSSTQSFNLSGLMLTGAPGSITVSAPAGFEVSSVDNATWGTSTTVNYSSATLADKQVNVRFKPTECTPVSNATLMISGGGATVIPTVSLSGTGIIPAPTATEETAVTDTSFTAHWDAVTGATGYELDVYTKEDVLSNNTTVVGWNFDDENVTSDEGITVNLSRSITTTAGTIEYSTTSVSGYSAHNEGGWVSGSGTKYWQVSFETTNVSNIKLSSVQRSSNTGPRNFKVQYSINGTDWTDVSGGNINVANNWTSGVLNNVSLPTACENQSLVYVRWIMTSNLQVSSGNVSATGISRIDNVKIIGDQNVETKTYVTNYNPKTISGGSTISDVVTGLTPDTQYHYVVRATTSTCESADSNEIDVKTSNNVVWDAGAWSNTTGPTATLNAIVRAPFVVGANTAQTSFTAKDLTVESTGSLEIPANQSITVAGNITTADDKIIIDSEGSLLQTNAPLTNQNTGKIIAKRNTHMRKMDYTYWGTPVTGQKLLNTSNSSGGTNPALYNTGGFSEGTPNNRIYQYNEPNDTFKAATDADFVPAKAYAIRGKDGYAVSNPSNSPIADEFSFTGIANNGSYTVGIQKSKNTTSGTPATEYTHGYNMIGNPYPSSIDFIKFYNLDHGDGTKNSDHILGKAWFWTNVPGAPTSQGGSSYTPNNYAILTLAGGAPATGINANETTGTTGNPAPNEFIKVAQGFIVEMIGTPPTGTDPALTATLKFDNSIRTNNNTGHFYNSKTVENKIDRFWLKLISPYNIVNTILVAHMDGATNNYDANYDAELLSVGDDSFYSKLDTKKLQIQARANLNSEDVIPVGTKYSTSGNYKISLGNKEGIFESEQKIYLKDKLTGSVTDLTAQDYIFAGSKGIDDTRFEIVYKSSEVLGNEGVTKSDFAVYRDGGSFIIRSSFNLGKIELYDVSGKLISTTSSSNKEFRLDATSLPSGVYIIRAENSGNIRTKKIIK